MSGLSGKRESLKELIKRLHKGETPEKIKREFQKMAKDVTPGEIAQIEQELIKEGMPREEIQKFCDVHLSAFKDVLEKEKLLAPPGHPVHILMEEHKILLKFANDLKDLANVLKGEKDFVSADVQMRQLDHIAEHLKASESHYVREENVLFPYLEKHGITEPPAIMWTEHDKIREVKKTLYETFDARNEIGLRNFTKQVEGQAISLLEMLSDHFYKENNILFPTALRVITEDEWPELRRQFDELGYCCFTPETARKPFARRELRAETPEAGGELSLDTGSLSKEEIESILNTLPVDITFIDKEDTVKYFSQTRERIFPRTKAVIGRKVQQCHPQKSLHLVNQLLEEFKSGKRDEAAFWINVGDRLAYIRYFTVRSKNGDYLGCVEVTQDITEVKRTEGEKRLL